MRHRARRDSNHAQVRDALRKAGWRVTDTGHVGNGFPDLVAQKHDRVEFIEVKDGSKPPSARKLTEDEADLHAALKQAGVEVRIIESVEQAIRLGEEDFTRAGETA